MELSALTPEELTKLSLNFASTIFSQLALVMYHKGGIRDYDITTKEQYTLSIYGKEFCESVYLPEDDIELLRFQESLRHFAVYVDSISTDNVSRKSVKYTLKERVKKDMMAYMRRLSKANI